MTSKLMMDFISHFQRRRLGVLVALALTGCGTNLAPASKAPLVAEVAEEPEDPNVANVVELSNAKVIREEEIVRFELGYRFTSGRPNKFYQVVFSIPGTKNTGIRPMDAWELKKEGTIRDGIQLQDPQKVDQYEIQFLESTSPMLPYKPIAKSLKGAIGNKS